MYCICEVGDESLQEKKTRGICQNSWVSPHHQSSPQLLAMSHLWQSIDSAKIDFFKNRYFKKDFKNNVKTELTTQNNSLLPVDAKIRK